MFFTILTFKAHDGFVVVVVNAIDVKICLPGARVGVLSIALGMLYVRSVVKVISLRKRLRIYIPRAVDGV